MVEIVNMDEFKLQDTLNKVLALSFEERNILYFKIKDLVEKLTPDESSRAILSLFLDLLTTSKEKISNSLSEYSDDDSGENKMKGGLFRRVSS